MPIATRHAVKRTWRIHDGSRRQFDSVAALKTTLMRLRGITQPDRFFVPNFERDTHDPLQLSDMQLAVDRIFSAMSKGHHILVYGDYDADGISSTALLVTVLTRLGAHVTPFLPHRLEHGYGLNEKVLRDVAGDIDLLIAVDCGIGNAAEIAALRKRRVDTIVVDHHTLPDELPRATAILHPRHPAQAYPFAWLCGAGLTWKLAQALLRDRRASVHRAEELEKWLLDLALLGTVADVVPLQDENRAITHFGLEVLKRTQRPGLRSLLLRARCLLPQLSTRDVAFHLVPRLNAAGRVDHPQPALDLLLADSQERADTLVAALEQLNNRRRTLSRRVVREAEAQVGVAAPALVFAASADWPAGVVGLAAARLAAQYGRPAVVVGQAGESYVGSARSPANSNVMELLTVAAPHLEKLGGHMHAAGFTVKPGALADFHATLAAAAELSRGTDSTRIHVADAAVAASLVQGRTVDMVRTFAPFGEGNEEPLFVIHKLFLESWRPVGKDNNHAKCSFLHEGSRIDGIAFGLAAQMQEELTGHKSEVDVLCSIEENEFRGRTALQLAVRDVAPAGKVPITYS